MRAKLALLMVACLMMTHQARAASKTVAALEKTPALQISKIEGLCVGAPNAVECQAYHLLRVAQIRLQGVQAGVAISVFDVEYQKKPRSNVHKEAEKGQIEISEDVLPLLDRAEALHLPTNIVEEMKRYRKLALGCASRMDLSDTDVVDDYNTRADACNVPVQVQLDKVFKGLGYPAQKPLVGYRKSHWGDSKSDVIAAEGKPLVTKDDTLIYQVKLDSHQAFSVFTFIEDKLVKGSYKFTDEHSNSSAFIGDYDALSAVLAAKYGKPSSHEAEWSNDLFKNDSEHWGTAVAAGQVTFSEFWGAGDTDIFHVLSGDNFKVYHIIQYSSVQYKPLINKSESQHASDGL